CRSLIETQAAELLPPEGFVRALQTAQAAAEQTALLRVLGGYSKGRFSAEDHNYLITRLATLASTGSSAAAKSAASWCLSQWSVSLPQSEADAFRKASPSRNWFLNSLGQTMIVIPAGEKFL